MIQLSNASQLKSRNNNNHNKEDNIRVNDESSNDIILRLHQLESRIKELSFSLNMSLPRSDSSEAGSTLATFLDKPKIRLQVKRNNNNHDNNHDNHSYNHVDSSLLKKGNMINKHANGNISDWKLSQISSLTANMNDNDLQENNITSEEENSSVVSLSDNNNMHMLCNNKCIQQKQNHRQNVKCVTQCLVKKQNAINECQEASMTRNGQVHLNHNILIALEAECQKMQPIMP